MHGVTGGLRALEDSVQAVAQKVLLYMESRWISTSMQEEPGMQGGSDASSGEKESTEEGVFEQDAEVQTVKAEEESSEGIAHDAARGAGSGVAINSSDHGGDAEES